MSTITQIYCQSDEPPCLQDIVSWLIDEGHDATIDRETTDADPESPDWDTADVVIGGSGCAIQLDALREGGEGEFEAECGKFERKFNDLEEVGETDPVRDHLSTVTYIIRIQLPFDADDSCQEASGIISQNLAANEAGIIHIEGEGFFDSEGEMLLDLTE